MEWLNKLEEEKEALANRREQEEAQAKYLPLSSGHIPQEHFKKVKTAISRYIQLMAEKVSHSGRLT